MDKNAQIQAFGELMKTKLSSGTVTMIFKQLETIKFFEMPMSEIGTGSEEGALFNHSYAMIENLLSLTKKLNLKWKRPESPYIIGAFHALHLCDDILIMPDGTYECNIYRTLTGRGEKSVIMAQSIMSLTDEEILCIRWYNAAHDDERNWSAYQEAIKKYPNVLFTHTAYTMAALLPT